jgi:nitric oxide reductase NorE protein
MYDHPAPAPASAVAVRPAQTLEPPGGILVWMIVGIELLTFAAGLGVFVAEGRAAEASFRAGRDLLNQHLALANTLILLTGGWCMAECLASLRRGAQGAAGSWILAAIGTGLVFLALKSFEYVEKIGLGAGFGDDPFFTLYFALTGFHFLHVLVAVVLLGVMARGIYRGTYTREDHADVEGSGIFWHMCDLIWLLIYPVIYLL